MMVMVYSIQGSHGVWKTWKMKVVMELENPQKSHGNLEMVMENLGIVREFTL